MEFAIDDNIHTTNLGLFITNLDEGNLWVISSSLLSPEARKQFYKVAAAKLLALDPDFKNNNYFSVAVAFNGEVQVRIQKPGQPPRQPSEKPAAIMSLADYRAAKAVS